MAIIQKANQIFLYIMVLIVLFISLYPLYQVFSENINFYGDNRWVELPVYLFFTWWQGKPQWENGSYTIPHLAVQMSFEDYKANRDPVPDAALHISNSDFIIDPMAYLWKRSLKNFKRKSPKW